MKTKRGISLVVLVITIIVMTILGSITILSINNVLEETRKDDFVVELATIKDKIKEYYLMTGILPVKSGIEYSSEEISDLLTDTAYQIILLDEISSNKDVDNKFLIVDLELMEIETAERGKEEDVTDIFVVATNTLNVYYLKGIEIEGSMKFSLATLVNSNEIEGYPEKIDTKVELDTKLNIIKSTNVWTNEISITINNDMQPGETLQYSVSGGTLKEVPSNNVITINPSNMTDDEVANFDINKQVTISRVREEKVIETKQVSIQNLDIANPQLGTLEIIDTSDSSFNIIKINSVDEGSSGIKSLYYDYVSRVVDGVEVSYYSNRTNITVEDLVSFGKATSDGIIKLKKNIKSIMVVAIDNAGNRSAASVYTIGDTYITSE